MLAAPAVYSKHNIITIPFTYTQTHASYKRAAATTTTKNFVKGREKCQKICLSVYPPVRPFICMYVYLFVWVRDVAVVVVLGKNPSTQFAFQFFPFVRMQGCQFFCHSFLKNNKKIKIHHILKCYSSLSHTQLIALFLNNSNKNIFNSYTSFFVWELFSFSCCCFLFLLYFSYILHSFMQWQSAAIEEQRRNAVVKLLYVILNHRKWICSQLFLF